jgi:hypothetical protein
MNKLKYSTSSCHASDYTFETVVIVRVRDLITDKLSRRTKDEVEKVRSIIKARQEEVKGHSSSEKRDRLLEFTDQSIQEVSK